jgi:FkbM family methyltransferase
MPGIERIAAAGRGRARQAFLRSARRLTPFVAAVHAGETYVLSTRDDGVGRAAFTWRANPEWKALEHALALLRSRGLAPAGSVFVDVGANIGTTAIPAVSRHGFGRALAFEPDPENVRVLKANVALNGLDDRVEVVAAAVSNVEATLAFGRGVRTRRGWRAGAGSLDRAGRAEEVVDVAVVTLDGALARAGVEPDAVGLLWLDVQGHEAHALSGAPGLLERRPPAVVALRPRKLAKAASPRPLAELLAGYVSLVDLRDPALENGAEPVVRPAAALAELLAAGRATDVLVF